MNNWLNQLERKYGRFGIPNLTNILVGGQILVLAIELFVNQTVSVWLALSRYFLLRGQIWRIITFAFIPSYGGSILSAVLGIYFTWFIGTALEQEWGDFRYTVYLLSGMLGTVLACLLTGVTAAGLCHAVPGGTGAAVLCHPHPGKILWLFCGSTVGAQLSGRAAAAKAEPAAQHGERLAVLWPDGLSFRPRMGTP